MSAPFRVSLLPHGSHAAQSEVTSYWTTGENEGARTQRFLLTSRPSDAQPCAAARQRIVAASVWLWSALGSLGKRSRRGFGSVRLCELTARGGWDCPRLDPWQSSPGNRDAVVTALRTRFEQCQQAIAGAMTVLDRLPSPARARAVSPNSYFHVANPAQILVGRSPWPRDRFHDPASTPIRTIMQACHDMLRAHGAAYSAAVGSADPRFASSVWIRLIPVTQTEILPMATYGGDFQSAPLAVRDLMSRLQLEPIVL